MITLTVAICTYNRARLLPQALDSLLAQTLPAASFEILVVDNGSTDGACDIVAAYERQRPGLRRVDEPCPGIAYARNRALQAAAGDYVAFLDDDAWAEPEWLEALIAPLCDIGPKLAGVVGPVLLAWEGERPAWFPPQFEPLLCRYDMGDAPCLLGPGGYLLTTNALFDRRVILSLGGFRTHLGRRRGRPLGGEDTEMYQRLIDAGQRIFYQPVARVHHGVPRDRQTRRYLLHRLFWDGASQSLLAFGAAQERGRPYHPWREAFRDLRQCGRCTIELLGGLGLLRQHAAWDALLRLTQRLGRLRAHVEIGMEHTR